MNTIMARGFFKKTTLYLAAFVVAVSSLTAAVPFILSKQVGAAAPYNVTVTPYCDNGLVAFDIKGDNPDNGQSAIWVKSSAAFELSEAVLAQPGTTASVPLKTKVSSVPASAATIYISPTEDGQYTLLNDPSAMATYGAFNCYDTVYVSTTGNDANTGTTIATAFATIQKALNMVNENGTVFVADGDYYGTANFVKNGTKLVGITNSRDTVNIHPAALSGQAGIFVNGVNNVTIKNLGVYGDNFVVAGSGGLIKLNDGSNARIENVAVKNSSATGININSYSNVVVSGVFVAGAGKDGISVVAQQNTTVNSSHDISITGTTIAGPAWSSIAFYTSTGTSKSITNVTITDVRTQYGQRGLYVEGNTGKTVTSPSNNKLVLQNFYAGDNSNEYINNEQSADIDVRGININVGNGVVVPASQMTQAQYDTVVNTRIKDRDHKSSVGNNYGRVQLVDITAPELSLKTAGGTSLINGGFTNQRDVVAEWTKSVGTTQFTYKYWNDIANNQYKENSPYTVQGLTGTSQSGSFTEGDGTHFMQVVAFDAMGGAKESNIFAVTYDSKAPVVSGVANNGIYRGAVDGIKVTDQNFSQLFINGSPVATQNVGGSEYAPVTPVSGDGTYTVRATDKAGNESTVLKFTIDNSVVVLIDEDDINTTVANPMITGRVLYVADNAPVANQTLTVDVDGVEYDTTTNANGIWSFTANNLANGDHVISFGDVEVASFTTAIPTASTAGGVPTVPVPLPEDNGATITGGTTPTIINPTTFASVLGNSTANNSPAVEGASTENKAAQAGSVDSEANQGLFLGLSWYWWLLIIAAIATLAWWIIAAARRRQAEN